MIPQTYSEVVTFLVERPQFDFDESISLLTTISAMLSSREQSHMGRDLVIRLLAQSDKLHVATNEMLNDLVEAAGLHPYVEPEALTGPALLRREFYKSDVLPEVFLHDEQMYASLLLRSNNSLILSAPTSFGKSLLIEEIVASKKYKNIVIVQPTLALLDETRKKLLKYKDSYNIVVSTSQSPGDANIFLFTAERVVEYSSLPVIDFFVIDEFYKLSVARDDERSTTLNLALYRLLQMTNKFYMLGPSINNIPDGFSDKYGAIWHKTDFSTVAVDSVFVESDKSSNEHNPEEVLCKLLDTFEDSTLIYCSTPSKASKLMAYYLRHVKEHNLRPNEVELNSELIEWIDENIEPHWNLKESMEWSIACHHGALPRHLSSSIVDAFNQGRLKYLFCTSTLIEGVNTSTKNLVLFDKKKGPKPIDFFDYRNIVGRAGRMGKHFVGRIYEFYKGPRREEVNVDVAIHTQTDAPLELLIQMDERDLTDASNNRLKRFHDLDDDIKSLLRNNIGAPIEGQLKILDILESNFEEYYPFISWHRTPTYEQLEKTIELAWNHLLKKNESKGGVRSPRQLAYLTNGYVRYKSIKPLIRDNVASPYWRDQIPDEYERTQVVVLTVLSVVRHWFNYKLPKLFHVLNELQSYICEKKNRRPGNYKSFAVGIESNFLPKNLSVLLEYGIPASAIQKLLPMLRDVDDLSDVITRLRTINLSASELLPYEINKLMQLL